jgi:hypothetical protein
MNATSRAASAPLANNILIAFELHSPQRNDDVVSRVIRDLGGFCSAVKPGFWYVKADVSALEVCARLWAVMDPKDSLFVVDASNKKAAWQNIDRDSSEALRHHWYP